VWDDLVQLAGKDKLIARAKQHLAAGRQLHALHLIDIVLKGEPANRKAREIEIAALTQLMDQGKGELLDEQGWLETSLAVAREAIGE
jgi:alkyl sulfatase BDS1-like metallo-beta-lactamase superfamily hydrolase